MFEYCNTFQLVQDAYVVYIRGICSIYAQPINDAMFVCQLIPLTIYKDVTVFPGSEKLSYTQGCTVVAEFWPGLFGSYIYIQKLKKNYGEQLITLHPSQRFQELLKHEFMFLSVMQYLINRKVSPPVYLQSFLKCHVQFCLIASLIARLHGKASGSCNQSQNNRIN